MCIKQLFISLTFLLLLGSISASDNCWKVESYYPGECTSGSCDDPDFTFQTKSDCCDNGVGGPGCLDDVGSCWTVDTWWPRKCQFHETCPQYHDRYDDRSACCQGDQTCDRNREPDRECFIVSSWYNPRECESVTDNCDGNGNAFLSKIDCCDVSFGGDGCGYDFGSCYVPLWNERTCFLEEPCQHPWYGHLATHEDCCGVFDEGQCSTQAPTTQAPITQAPITQAPITQAPITQAPTTPTPTTQAPITLAPTTQAPTPPDPYRWFVTLSQP
jgi:hypothetical protein